MRALIIEDEIMVAQALKRMIANIVGVKLTSLDHVECVADGELFLQGNEIDVVFLDLNLGGENGFDLLTEMVAQPFQTIVVSANTDQALQAYELGVVDFVPKPFLEDRLSDAIARLDTHHALAHAGCGNAKFLGIRHRGNTRIVAIDDVVRIQAAAKYSELYLASGSVFMHEKNLGQLMMLLPENFQRVHKSHAVDLLQIQDLVCQPGSKYELVLISAETVPVGRSFVSALRARLA